MQDLKGTDRELDMIYSRRNPYLIDYEQERKRRMQTGGGRSAEHAARRQPRPEMRQVRQEGRQPRPEMRQVRPEGRQPRPEMRQVRPEGRQPRPEMRQVRPESRQPRPEMRQVRPESRQPRPEMRQVRQEGRQPRPEMWQLAGGQSSPGTFGKKAQAAARARRRKIVRRQRIAVGAWILCLMLIGICFLWGNTSTSAAEKDKNAQDVTKKEDLISPSVGTMVQGLPAGEFAKHPAWTENFLTPNEYSRPGDALEEVNSIFVHYTANPGTSAAQNRSYFEQQKDMHEASVSAHFIIGYEGEIIQCLPLDEIGYAVMTRNYDSISIECCYKAENGSFTQETYDSLISLLAWLTEVYDLDVEDILRHYDCGGKKCPLYYTEHPDAWEQLKEDVAAARE